MIPETVLRQLHHVKVEDPTLDLHCFPNFLIVGPQRTGTSWLFHNLTHHPQIFLSHPKELFFFNNLKNPGVRFQSNRLDWYLRFFQDDWCSELWRRKQKLCLSAYDEPYRPIMRGEATASYAHLDEKIIREIAVLNPKIRIIMMIRNPIDRAWSHAKRHFIKKQRRSFDDITDEEIEAFFRDPYQINCGLYTQNMDRWLSAIDNNALFIGQFDDLRNRPEGLLLDLMLFLDVRSDRKYIRPDAKRVVGATTPLDLPSRYRTMLESLFREEAQRLEERFAVSWP